MPYVEIEEGIKLSKTCLKMLDDAERKVEILVQDKDGKPTLDADRATVNRILDLLLQQMLQ